MDRAGVVYYYYADGLGSIVALTDVTEAVAESYSYTPFGAVESTGNVDNPYTYTGREWDEEAGLYYYRARYYDPELGRFISPDTIVPDPKNPQSLNRYSYVLNNPLKYVDPTGNLNLEVDHNWYDNSGWPGYDPYLDFGYGGGGSGSSWGGSGGSDSYSWGSGGYFGGSTGSGFDANGGFNWGSGGGSYYDLVMPRDDGYIQADHGEQPSWFTDNVVYHKTYGMDALRSGDYSSWLYHNFAGAAYSTANEFLPRKPGSFSDLPMFFIEGLSGGKGRLSPTLLRHLKPGGKLIGEPYRKNELIRTLKGGPRDAGKFFRELTVDAERFHLPTYKGTVMELPDGGVVGYRRPSNGTSGVPTIDVMKGFEDIKKIKFNR